MNILRYFVFILVLISNSSFLCAENYDISVKDLFTNFFDDETKPENLNILRASYGIVFTDPNFADNDKMAVSYNSQIDYGFSRIRQFDNYPNIFAHSSESVFVGSISSHLKPTSISKNGLTIDVWRFGFGLKNGMGYNLPNSGKLFLTHSGSLVWTRTDFEMISQEVENAAIQSKFDEKMKFGTMYSGGIEMQVLDFINISAEYEHSIILSDFTAGGFFGAWMTDNLLQRWVDFLDPILIREFQDNYPVIKWAYKNSISLLLNSIRSTHGTFPFGSEMPMNYRGGNIRVCFFFN